MGRLFENVKMDIQAERRKVEAERKKAEEAEEKLERMEMAFEIYKQINRMLRRDCSEAEIKEALIADFSLTGDQAEAEYRKVLEE